MTTGAVNKDMKRKRNFAENHFYNILTPFDVCQTIFSQVKRNAIIINKHGKYKFPHKFLIDVKLRILGKQK